MPNQTIDADVRTVRELKEEDLEWCDILHYSRHSLMSAKFLDQMRSKYGFKIIVDTDDWWEVQKDHPLYEKWRKSAVSLQIQSHLLNADAVTCTTERLLDIVPNNAYVIPNGLNYGKGQFRYRKQKKGDRVRLLYASTVMNYSNTAIIASAMKRIKHLPIEVVIAGHHESPFFDILVSNLTAGGEIPYRFTKWADSESYMLNYEGDIGILPSKPTLFNSYKSNLKVLEFAALKIPAVVSNCDPYLRLPVNYFTGENEFVEQVTKLVESEELRESCGKELFDFCKKNYSLSGFSDTRLKAYDDVQRNNSH